MGFSGSVRVPSLVSWNIELGSPERSATVSFCVRVSTRVHASAKAGDFTKSETTCVMSPLTPEAMGSDTKPSDFLTSAGRPSALPKPSMMLDVTWSTSTASLICVVTSSTMACCTVGFDARGPRVFTKSCVSETCMAAQLATIAVGVVTIAKTMSRPESHARPRFGREGAAEIDMCQPYPFSDPGYTVPRSRRHSG